MNPRNVLLSEPADIAWLRDVHVRELAPDVCAAVVYGNEDCPDRVDVWTDPAPSVGQAPAATYWTPPGACDLVRVDRAAVASARYAFRQAETAGHAAQCATAWKGQGCTCPGRVAIHGTAAARGMGEREERARGALFRVDPDARAWIAARGD